MSDKTCEVKECNNDSFKTVPAELAKKVFSLDEKKTKVHLCKEHYKEYKKETKQERELKRMDWV
ncbi:MAG: hypothetical protein M0T81_01505 [Thermoplasmatales archaeon]|nr:hypothetical protein [Thermoplasmatales archaeon]